MKILRTYMACVAFAFIAYANGISFIQTCQLQNNSFYIARQDFYKKWQELTLTDESELEALNEAKKACLEVWDETKEEGGLSRIETYTKLAVAAFAAKNNPEHLSEEGRKMLIDYSACQYMFIDGLSLDAFVKRYCSSKAGSASISSASSVRGVDYRTVKPKGK